MFCANRLVSASRCEGTCIKTVGPLPGKFPRKADSSPVGGSLGRTSITSAAAAPENVSPLPTPAPRLLSFCSTAVAGLLPVDDVCCCVFCKVGGGGGRMSERRNPSLVSIESASPRDTASTPNHTSPSHTAASATASVPSLSLASLLSPTPDDGLEPVSAATASSRASFSPESLSSSSTVSPNGGGGGVNGGGCLPLLSRTCCLNALCTRSSIICWLSTASSVTSPIMLMGFFLLPDRSSTARTPNRFARSLALTIVP
mmetsp:Transcript_84519/g.164068  ORF Transcript_84519/g.164068 Transcript_84519/m.164068 type:complete len:258 (-) Transcript_84519:548-1321(-)